MFSGQKYIFSTKIYFQYKNIFPVQKYISSTKIYFRLGKLKKVHVAHIRFKMAEPQTSRLLNKQSTANFCSSCAFRVEKSYHFCPKCGEGIKTNGNVVDDGIVGRKKEPETTSTDTSCKTSKFVLPRFALPSFAAFKSTKEKE